MGKSNFLSLKNITREKVASLYSYDSATGNFTTVTEVSPMYPAGEVRMPVVGRPKSNGKKVAALKVDGVLRRATHIAYLLMTGEHVPDRFMIVHKNGDHMDLRWDNLLLAPMSSGGVL